MDTCPVFVGWIRAFCYISTYLNYNSVLCTKILKVFTFTKRETPYQEPYLCIIFIAEITSA